MTDIALVMAPDGTGADLAVVNGDLATDDTLLTAVIISLGCNRVADASDGVPPGGDMGGWWGDAYLPPLPDGAPDYIGCKAWLYLRCTATQVNANKICAAFRDGLAWMIVDGVAADVAVTGTWASATALQTLVTIVQITAGGVLATRQFDLLWNATTGTVVVQ